MGRECAERTALTEGDQSLSCPQNELLKDKGDGGENPASSNCCTQLESLSLVSYEQSVEEGSWEVALCQKRMVTAGEGVTGPGAGANNGIDASTSE